MGALTIKMRRKWGKLVINSIIGAILCTAFSVSAKVHFRPGKDSAAVSHFIGKPSSYIMINSMLSFKGGFKTDFSPGNFIPGTRFSNQTTGMELGFGIPIFKYIGVCGQYNAMAVNADLGDYAPASNSQSDNLLNNGDRYHLRAFSAGIMITLPTKLFSLELEARAGNMHFYTPEIGMLVNYYYDDNFENVYRYVIDRPAHTYSVPIYSFSFQSRFFLNKYITLSLRLSNYIIPQLVASSVNFDTRVPNYTIATNPNIAFKYQSIGIGLGIKLPGLNIR